MSWSLMVYGTRIGHDIGIKNTEEYLEIEPDSEETPLTRLETMLIHTRVKGINTRKGTKE